MAFFQTTIQLPFLFLHLLFLICASDLPWFTEASLSNLCQAGANRNMCEGWTVSQNANMVWVPRRGPHIYINIYIYVSNHIMYNCDYYIIPCLLFCFFLFMIGLRIWALFVAYPFPTFCPSFVFPALFSVYSLQAVDKLSQISYLSIWVAIQSTLWVARFDFKPHHPVLILFVC